MVLPAPGVDHVYITAHGHLVLRKEATFASIIILLIFMEILIKLYKRPIQTMDKQHVENEFMMQGEENFFIVSMKGKDSFVKVYDSTTRLRICRRIALPEGIPICC